MDRLEDNARLNVIEKCFITMGFTEQEAKKLALVFKKYRSGGYNEPKEPASFSV